MKYFNLSFWTLAIIAAFTFSSCVDNDFDAPEATLSIPDDMVVSTASVLAKISNNGTVLTDSLFIKGVVTANDESGNFFKTLTFEDETGPMSIILDQNELNAAYPEGNTVYVLLKGLTMGYDNNNPRLGLGVDGGNVQRVPDVLVSKYVIAGGPVDPLEPLSITIDEFNNNPTPYLNKLIKLENVEFSSSDVGQTYAIANNADGEPEGVNRYILNCDGDEVILRNSGFASFVNDIVPVGNGTLIAVASKYRSDLQLLIRDTDDVIFEGERCDGGGTQAGDEITIGSIKERFYDSGADKVQEGYITGVVISDKNSGQVNGQNIIIQNGEHGIFVRFTGDHNYNLGDMLQITVSGIELSEYRGVLQINNVPLFNVIDLGTGALPDPKELTVSEFLSDNNRYESMRLLIKNAMLTSTGGTYSGNVDLEDNTGTCILRTATFANFANEPVPSGIVEVVCIGSQYTEGAVDEIQVMINDPSDVSGGTVTPVETLFNDDFENGLGKWTAVSVSGDQAWEIVEFGNPGNCAKMSGYVSANMTSYVNEDWLISGSIDATDVTSLTLAFDNANNYSGNDLELLISTDYNGQGNPNDATWTEFSYEKTAGDSWDYITSGNIDLSDFVGGEFTVAFKYTSDSSASKTWEIDNLIVKGEN